MSELVWTEEKPTEPGWYWAREKANPARLWVHLISSVEIRHSELLYDSGLDEAFDLFEFAGPIPQPLQPIEREEG